MSTRRAVSTAGTARTSARSSCPTAYQQGMTMRKAAYKVAARAAPDAYVIDRGPYCDDCGKCVEVCPSAAIDLDEQPRLLTIEVGAIILALGFQIYDPTELEELGYGRYPNVLARHAVRTTGEPIRSHRGPDRPPLGPASAALDCLAAMYRLARSKKHFLLVDLLHVRHQRSHARQAAFGDDGRDAAIFIMDERAFNKEYSRYFATAREKYGIRYIRCRVSTIQEDPATHDLILHYAEPDGQRHEERFEAVVLATGLQPPDSAQRIGRNCSTSS